MPRAQDYVFSDLAKERMGPRKQGLNRSTGKAAQGGANKNKQPKSLKNKLRDVQRLLKKVSLQSVPANLDMCCARVVSVRVRERYGHSDTYFSFLLAA